MSPATLAGMANPTPPKMVVYQVRDGRRWRSLSPMLASKAEAVRRWNNARTEGREGVYWRIVPAR